MLHCSMKAKPELDHMIILVWIAFDTLEVYCHIPVMLTSAIHVRLKIFNVEPRMKEG